MSAVTPSELCATSPIADVDDSVARRSLRRQIGHLEAELGDLFVTAFAMRIDGSLLARACGDPSPSGPPRLVDLGELEVIRDELVERRSAIRSAIEDLAAVQALRRDQLERMLLEPGRHRFTRISRRELGEPGCGVWSVRPRLGLLGMLMGWWEVKVSSGCPLA